MEEYTVYSRKETASAEVENGRIVKIYLSDDRPRGKTVSLKRDEADFFDVLWNVFDAMNVYNKKIFEELKAVIEQSDPECYEISKKV